MHKVESTGNRAGSERKVIHMPLGHVEIFRSSWIFRFGERLELKLTDLGIMSLTEAIKVPEIVNIGLFI